MLGGDGAARRLDCRRCDGPVDPGGGDGGPASRLMAPLALASGRDASLYVGDFNFVRKLAANRRHVASILQLGCVAPVYKKSKKGKVFPYSLPSVGPGADPGVQAVSSQVT